MKKLVLIAVFLLGFSVVAVAQDVPLAEVYGGYTYVRVNPLSDWNADDMNTNGWDASVTFNGNNWIGFVADFGGNYGTLMYKDINAWADVSIHSIMFGPKITIRRGKISPFVQALFGYARLKAKEAGDEYTENDFAMAFGGGVDVNLSKMISVRPVQVDYFGVKDGFSGDFINSFKYSAGIVLKLGSR